MLTFPPHCSHKLQPLYPSVYGPFKKYVNSASDAFIHNRARCITIYDIATIVNIAMPPSVTPSNIMAGFRVAGIMPFNREISTDDCDFAPSFMTDRENQLDSNELETLTEATQSPSSTPEALPSCSTSMNTLDILKIVRPFLKAAPRNLIQKGRKNSRSEVLTSTLVKELIEANIKS